MPIMTNYSFSFDLATLSDVPILAKISADAFTTDRHTRIKTLGQDPNSHSNMMNDVLSSWLKVPGRCSILKATDNTTGNIVGWICWGFHGYKKQGAPVSEEKKANGRGEDSKQESEKSKAEESSHDSRDGHGQSQPKVDSEHSGQTPIQRLESITNQDMTRWQKILMPDGTKCMIIVAIAVSPAYQSHGVGSALIRWGTEKADADGVFCWVHASEAGHKVFAKEGFMEVGRLEVDLDEFAPAPCEDEDGNGEWGRYTFRYMRRPEL
ncbi:hypothetical protein V1508DRAFT_427768 [Lipomyces doorenjongii]|uniref:uncharacterized protein n=1 Tax=Lipomyces doorenjongii TaxID=383834 RepID=UPI0034CE544D